MTIEVTYIPTEEKIFVEMPPEWERNGHQAYCRCVDCYGDFSDASSYNGDQGW